MADSRKFTILKHRLNGLSRTAFFLPNERRKKIAEFFCSGDIRRRQHRARQPLGKCRRLPVFIGTLFRPRRYTFLVHRAVVFVGWWWVTRRLRHDHPFSMLHSRATGKTGKTGTLGHFAVTLWSLCGHFVVKNG